MQKDFEAKMCQKLGKTQSKVRQKLVKSEAKIGQKLVKLEAKIRQLGCVFRAQRYQSDLLYSAKE